MTKQTKTATYELFHSMGDFFWKALFYRTFGGDTPASEIVRGFNDGHYQSVHSIELPTDDIPHYLEYIFASTQNLDEAWNPETPCRSTSVGDIVKVGSEYYIVAGEGFDLLPMTAEVPLVASRNEKSP